MRLFSTIFKVLAIITLLIGVISIAVGGIVFIILGCIFLYVSKYYSKLAKLKSRKAGNNDYLTQYDVYINKNSKVYHTSKTCHHLKPGFTTTNENNAIRKGYEICKNCKRWE